MVDKKNFNHLVVIYRYTGRQGWFTIPAEWCEECDLLLSVVQDVIMKHHLSETVRVVVRPWWIWWLVPLLRYGSWHAPQLIIDGKLISAGVVPERNVVERALGIS